MTVCNAGIKNQDIGFILYKRLIFSVKIQLLSKSQGKRRCNGSTWRLYKNKVCHQCMAHLSILDQI